MKKKLNFPLFAFAVLLTGLYSCSKETQTSLTKSTTTSYATTVSSASTAVVSTQAIAVGTLATTTTTSTAATAKDSLYMIGCYPPKGKKDSVAFSALPSAITAYLTSNYAGYTFLKAYKTTDSLKVTDGYVVIINFNSKPIGLKFTAAGVFVKVLEQREGPDLMGPGWHAGGQFGDRDGLGHDTIAISALPANIKAYFAATYPSDTLLHAAINARDTSYILISKDKGLFATVISSKAKLINRLQIDAKPAVHAVVLQAALPTAITTYLTATYPAYVFDKAFAEKLSGVIKEYDVFISVNTTRYAVKFDASGTFVSSMVIR